MTAKSRHARYASVAILCLVLACVVISNESTSTGGLFRGVLFCTTKNPPVTKKGNASMYFLDDADDGNHNHSSSPFFYQAAAVEDYMWQHAVELGYNKSFGVGATNETYLIDETGSGCSIWKDAKATNETIHRQLSDFKEALTKYYNQIEKFQLPFQDIRSELQHSNNSQSVCELLDFDLKNVFQDELSNSRSGLIEPLLPPFRHPNFCDEVTEKNLYDLKYLVHDFKIMCTKLTKTSRIVLLDMGASLSFKDWDDPKTAPPVYLVELYRKMGMPFDHIYAYEVTPSEPAEVFDKVPKAWLSAYHWINIGVSADESDKMNPLSMLLETFNENDLVVVKLDIDTPSIEVPIVEQLLKDERFEALVDQFYFEHHVHMEELATSWKETMKGSMMESLEMFRELRRKGIAAHYWV